MPESVFQPGDQVAAYLRDSGGDDQDQSVPQQETEVRAWCASHKLTLTQIYKDEAKTGSTTVGRNGFWKMVQHFHNGAGERGVVIWRTNRFGRNINDSQYHKADLRRRGFVVHSLKDNIPEGSAGQLIEFALDWKDQVFIEQLSEDVKRGLYQLVHVYRCVPGLPPRGFMRERVVIGKRRDGSDHIAHKWVPDPAMIPLVQRAFAMRAGGNTLRQIGEATGLYSSNNSWSTFFENRLYIGELKFGDEIIPDYCEPVIDREIWDEVQRVGLRRSRPGSTIDNPRRIVSSFLLSGLIHCQECGAPMSGYSIKRWSYYDCSRRKRRRDCTARRIPHHEIENQVLTLLENNMLALDNMLTIQNEMKSAWENRSHETGTARREIEKQLTALQKKIRNITKAIADHGHSKGLLNQLASFEIQEGDLRATLGQLDSTPRPAEYTPVQLSEIAAQLKEELHGDHDQVQSTVRGLVNRVVVRRTDNQILGVLYCNKVIGSVPPQRGALMTLLFPIEIDVAQRRL